MVILYQHPVNGAALKHLMVPSDWLLGHKVTATYVWRTGRMTSRQVKRVSVFAEVKGVSFIFC